MGIGDSRSQAPTRKTVKTDGRWGSGVRKRIGGFEKKRAQLCRWANSYAPTGAGSTTPRRKLFLLSRRGKVIIRRKGVLDVQAGQLRKKALKPNLDNEGRQKKHARDSGQDQRGVPSCSNIPRKIDQGAGLTSSLERGREPATHELYLRNGKGGKMQLRRK